MARRWCQMKTTTKLFYAKEADKANRKFFPYLPATNCAANMEEANEAANVATTTRNTDVDNDNDTGGDTEDLADTKDADDAEENDSSFSDDSFINDDPLSTDDEASWE